MSQALINEHIDPLKMKIAAVVYGEISKNHPEIADLPGVDAMAQWIERPAETSRGDWALPCFRLAKPLKQKPQDIAAGLAAALGMESSLAWLKKIEATAGFLNFFATTEVIGASLYERLKDQSFFKAFASERLRPHERVMVEFSQPNTHKEFHVGHLRNACLGDALVRIMRYCGYQVIAANYPGDEGAHIAKCLWYIKHSKSTPPATGKGEWLGSMYTAAMQTLSASSPEEQAQYQSEISAILRAIEAKEGKDYDLWKETRGWSLELFFEVYKWLGIEFDQYFFESELSEAAQKIVDEYLQKGVFAESDGAIGLDLKEYKLGFLLLRKRDGNTLYATKDLALARRKFQEFKIDRSVYVVADEQNLHFKQVFKALELMGFENAKQCQHLSYGMVRLPTGKMSSRDGNIVKCSDLRAAVDQELDKVLRANAELMAQISEQELNAIKNDLCVGAIRHGMLATDPVKEVLFNLNDWLAFEGDTGPYLMYAFARTRAILRKAGDVSIKNPNPALLQDPGEHELLRQLYDFNAHVANAAKELKPSLIAHYLFDLCKIFNRFYAQVRVLQADSAELREARLGLVQGFNRVLGQGLQLLGIHPPERM